ncbi:hypothetical protein E3N88_35072 [Mikania micrantha]|uniref:Integrase catalytic domain-containing protein n=1 Tax=Mikania micrantha TaxID=192012 RepID=A0A5N6M0C9_9ASTR|nr:hypothetical protein E3N88_35072 [Mikania micrantha]
MLMVERQFNTKLKSVQTDWGGEFRNLSSFFSSIGVIHRLSCPHTSEQNGLVERRLRHVVETGLTLLAQSHVPQRFWHFAFDTAVYLINRMPSRTNSHLSPFELVFHRSPDFSFLRVFGCQCYPHLRPYNNHKMDFRSHPCVFLGYSTTHHGYRCFDQDSERIYVARHVRFNESLFPFSNQLLNTSHPPPHTSTYPSATQQSTTTAHSPLHPTPTAPSPQPMSSTTDPNCESAQSTFVVPSQPTRPPLIHTYKHRSKNISTTPTRSRPPNLRSNPVPTKPYNASSFHTQSTSQESEPATFNIANKHPQ